MLDRRSFLSLAVVACATRTASASNRIGHGSVTQVKQRDVALVGAARQQIGVTVGYDPGYAKLDYPLGDVPRSTGVCTDVVVRAYRDGLDIDLQRLVHEDMRKNFSAYPKIWGLKKPDRNIDHRRVPNLMVFFKRHGVEKKISDRPQGFIAGDLVTMMLPGNLPHIGLVSDAFAENTDRPLLIHNIGQGTREEDILFRYPLTGQFRYALS